MTTKIEVWDWIQAQNVVGLWNGILQLLIVAVLLYETTIYIYIYIYVFAVVP
jgi:hypothetical protein